MLRSVRIHVLINSRLRRSEGGRETWAHTFIPALADALPEGAVKVYGIRERGVATREEESFSRTISGKRNVSVDYIDVQRRWYPYFLQMWRGLFARARRGALPAPDCVLTLGVFEFAMTFLAPYRRSLRIVWLRSIFLNEKAGRVPGWLAPLARRLEILLLKRADIVLSNGDDIAEYYEGRGLDVHVVKNGLDLGRWRSGTRRIAPPISVAFVGRLDEIKGIEEFTAMAEKIKNSSYGADFEFHVAGSGPFESSSAYRGRARYFRSHGTVPNEALPGFLANIDVCVALTRSSMSGGGAGISNALLEQIASGAVIVAWDSAIFRQVVDTSEAYLVAEGDSTALADAMVGIRDHPDEALRRAERALSKMDEFDIHERVRQFLAIVAPRLAVAGA